MHPSKVCSQSTINDASPLTQITTSWNQATAFHSIHQRGWSILTLRPSGLQSTLCCKDQGLPASHSSQISMKERSELLSHTPSIAIHIFFMCGQWESFTGTGPGEDSLPTTPWRQTFKRKRRLTHRRSRNYHLPSYWVWATSKSTLAKLRENEIKKCKHGSC